MPSNLCLLPPELLLDIISYVIEINNPSHEHLLKSTNLAVVKTHMQFISTFQSLSKRINSSEMMNYFNEFWKNVAKRFFSIGKLDHDEKLVKLLSTNLKSGKLRRKVLLALHVKNLLFREKIRNDLELNFILLGDGGVGKSTIAVRYIYDQFVEEYDPTIEDTYRKKLEFAGSTITLDILDTAGQEEFGNRFLDRKIRHSDCFIIVSAINLKSSILETRVVCEEIVRTFDRNDMPIVFAIHKIDLIGNDYERDNLKYFHTEISDIMNNCQLTNATIIECSAKISQNINILFEECIRMKYCKDIDYLELIENVIKYDLNYFKKNKNKHCILN